MPSEPDLLVVNHHPVTPFPVDRLADALRLAMRHMMSDPGPDHAPVLAALDEVEISLIDDTSIDRVHREFMAIAGATDVITFHHGEILISLDTAARQAGDLGHDPFDEVLLCGIHGLLHLHGHDDLEPAARARMHARQEALWNAIRRDFHQSSDGGTPRG